MRTTLQTFDLTTNATQTILATDLLIEAPNWGAIGFLVNAEGRLYHVPFDNAYLIPIDTGDLTRCNNDHAFTCDGTEILFGCHRGQGAELFAMPMSGGTPRLISPEPPTWLHGLHPDGSTMTYCAARGDKTCIDIYTKAHDAPERGLTQGEGMCDGPDYSADGAQIYYNCDRTGHAQIWCMNADGTDQHQLFADACVNWFPHPSPNGSHVLYLAYPPGTQGHPRDLPVALCLMTPDGQNRRRILTFTGGQGSINVPNWSPTGQQFAFIRYQQEPQMPVSSTDLVAAANAVVPRVTGEQARQMVADGAVLLDIRDSTELADTGKAVGSLHIPRGSLEFKADPASPSYEPKLQPNTPIVLHCAAGGRAALAGKLLLDMGYTQVFNLGGFKDWKAAGGAVE